MLQLRPRGDAQEIFRQQALQLLGAVCGRVRRVFRVLDFSGGCAKLQQHTASEARHFIGYQREA